MAMYYLPLSQSDYVSSPDILVRTAFDPMAISAAVQEQVWAVDMDAPITQVATMEQVVKSTYAEPKFRMLLLGSFGALGMLLALVGVYGVISSTVTQRRHEIGIRMALGAERSHLLRMVIGEGMRLAVAGITAGVIGALCLGRVLQSMLFELKPMIPQLWWASRSHWPSLRSRLATFPHGALRVWIPWSRCGTNNSGRVLIFWYCGYRRARLLVLALHCLLCASQPQSSSPCPVPTRACRAHVPPVAEFARELQ